MTTINGRVQFSGMRPTRSLQRDVERQIEKWIEREQSLLFLPRTGSFVAHIERTSEFPYYECALEIAIGAREWRSFEGGRTLHDALKSALRHLKTFNIVPFSPVPISHQRDNQNIVA